MSLFSKLAIFAATATEVNAAVGAGNICADGDSATPNIIKLGYKVPGTNCATMPSTHIEDELQHMVTITGTNTAYLTPGNTETVSKIQEATGKGDYDKAQYQVFKEEVKEEPGVGKYAYRMMGTFVGTVDKTGSYGFLGTAMYLMISGQATMRKNKFCIPGDELASNECGDICAVQNDPTTDPDCKQNGREFKAGDFKFSLYGYTAGDAFTPGTNTFLGFRKKVTFKDFAPASGNGTVSLMSSGTGGNKGTTYTLGALPANGIQGVSDFLVKGKASIKYTFPLWYNLGNTKTCTDDKYCPLDKASKQVHINLSNVAGESNAIYVDYLFDIVDLSTKDRFFVYDPDVTAGPEGSDAAKADCTDCEAVPAAAAAASGAMGMGLSGLVMMVFGFLMM